MALPPKRRSASSLGDKMLASPLSFPPHRLGEEGFASHHPDLDIDDLVDARQPLGRDGTTRHTSAQIAALVDFFTNYPPPPDNFMSMPHGSGGGDRGRGAWSKFRRMSKRSKSLPRSPQQIRLPDSAVSGTTIGGHRHISISVPLDVTPFAQYPGYSPRDLSTGIPVEASRLGGTTLLRLDSPAPETPRRGRAGDRSMPPRQWIKPSASSHWPARGKP